MLLERHFISAAALTALPLAWLGHDARPPMKPYILTLAALLCFGSLYCAETTATSADTAPAPQLTAPAQAAKATATATPSSDSRNAVDDKAADASATATDTAVTIGNAKSSVVIAVQWAEITQFKLLDQHPLALPAEIGGDETLDPKGPLSVLGPFNRDRSLAGHNSIIITQEGSWSLVSHTPTQAVFERRLGTLDYQLTYSMDSVRPTVHSSWVISNHTDTAQAVPIEICEINGVHQDLARNDAYFSGIYAFADGSLTSLTYPALPKNGQSKASTDYVWTADTQYIAMRSRFFAAIWAPGKTSMEPLHASEEAVKEEEEPVAAPEEKGNSARSVASRKKAAHIEDSESSDGSLNPNITITSIAFVGGPLLAEQHQAFINVIYKDQSGQDINVKAQQALTLNWSTTVTSMQSKDLALLTKPEAELEFASRWYRFWRLISNVLLWLLNTLNAGFEAIGLSGMAYGLAIICTTAIVKGVLHRVTYKQQYSMMKMQQLGPELRRLQAQYKGDRQAMAAKQMELWKKHGVNPFGGCLPMLIQMPIFFALFQVFNHAADMRGHGFLWVADLTLPDQTFPLGFNLPVIHTPASINILPLIYLPIALFQSLSMRATTPNSGDKQKDEMQETMQKMMRFMPLFFFLFVYFFASGLVLYMSVSSLWTLIEIRMIRKKLGMDTPKTAPAKT